MVLRVTALAELDTRPSAAGGNRSRADAGDPEEAWLLDQWQRRKVLLAKVDVSVVARDARGADVTAQRVIEGVWLERDNLPAVEAQVAEVAPAELPPLAEELRRRGAVVADEELEAGFLHVELGDGLRRALAEG
jgi:hypothetical protein